ncbi:hypothetical protein LEP1GSC058_2432 [Leptospira fainei serovar Hurstbridge str. BUT 6]|uniref:Uncharacterized protein n=1 Tax=Leptospira fainei serovar Hurstbridge str. BUT 6 TaxID=1193011 RepID=S3UZC1_9LEPT|nr:hypothetical protein LEP1GSC058_2432 [Leptospira fainei serovar Hurstbridge str. BUT 6]
MFLPIRPELQNPEIRINQTIFIVLLHFSFADIEKSDASFFFRKIHLKRKVLFGFF